MDVDGQTHGSPTRTPATAQWEVTDASTPPRLRDQRPEELTSSVQPESDAEVNPNGSVLFYYLNALLFYVLCSVLVFCPFLVYYILFCLILLSSSLFYFITSILNWTVVTTTPLGTNVQLAESVCG